jgi:O-antigen ligase
VAGLVTSPLAPDTFWAIQRSGLLVVISLPMAAAIAQRLATLDDIYKVLKMFILAGGLYVVLGLSTLPSLTGGARFTGATSSAPLFVLTGGLLLPIALWGALQSGIKQWRIYCVVIAITTGMLCIVSGQRTGTLAGFIGCLPLLARFGMRKLMIGLVLLVVGLALVYFVLSFMPLQAEFVIRRFTSADTTGRVERWQRALELCLRNPFLGQGVGADQTHHFGFHNAYLVTWIEMGLVGLFLYAGALVWMATRSLRLILAHGDREIQDVARLLLGLTLASMAAAFFESKLVSPSNVAIFMAVMVSVMLVRLKELADRGPVVWDSCDEYGADEDYEQYDSPPSTA